MAYILALDQGTTSSRAIVFGRDGRAVASAQHQKYEDALRALGCAVRHVPAANDLPDSVFVEDVAIGVTVDVDESWRYGQPARIDLQTRRLIPQHADGGNRVAGDGQ